MYINNDVNYLKYLRNKKVILFGAGETGKKVFYKLKKEKIEPILFCDNNNEKDGNTYFGITVVSYEKFKNQSYDNSFIIICSNREVEIKHQLLNDNIFNFASFRQIDFGGGEEYYDDFYFDYQKQMGQFGSKYKKRYFVPHINPDMTVVEFGSGGGYLLKEINAREKVGIEINDYARAEAQKNGINSVKYLEELPDNYADLIISTSVLEHVEDPLNILRGLKSKIKENGKIVFHVPNESGKIEYEKSEINNHLYTWNALHIGNLVKAAGFFVHSVENISAYWPEDYTLLYNKFGTELFDELTNIKGEAMKQYTDSVLIVAYNY